MRFVSKIVTGVAVALLLCAGASAGSDLNEVGAFLIYPAIAALDDDCPGTVRSFITMTNAGDKDVIAHISYINGDMYDSKYCYECDFDIPLTPNDTETLAISYIPHVGIQIFSLEGTVSRACAWEYGMIVVSLEDPVTGETITDNVLLGEQVVVNFDYGFAFSVPAIPFQGKNGGNGDRYYGFDDVEYGKLPRVVAADFLAPQMPGIEGAVFTADLVLLTPGFNRQYPPAVDCSIIGFDAAENEFSSSIQFGCWGLFDLCYVDPEFCWPNLGATYGDMNGWLQAHCDVDGADGGVHGAIFQIGATNFRVDRADSIQSANWAAWGRLLYQSVTTGDAVTLHLEDPPAGMD